MTCSCHVASLRTGPPMTGVPAKDEWIHVTSHGKGDFLMLTRESYDFGKCRVLLMHLRQLREKVAKPARRHHSAAAITSQAGSTRKAQEAKTFTKKVKKTVVKK